jgi:tetratricopeptide (TPR) repeat protein
MKLGSFYIVIIVMFFGLACSSTEQLTLEASRASDFVTDVDTTSNGDLLANTNTNAMNSMITDVDILDYYNSQAQTVFELYVEAQYQFRNMRYYNALSLLDRSIALVPTIQAYLLQVIIYAEIGDREKYLQAYERAQALNDAMGEDLLRPLEVLIGFSASSEND